MRAATRGRSWLSPPAARVLGCPTLPPLPQPTPPPCARRSPRRCASWAARSAAGRSQMAEAVADAMVDGKHLLVQAGTGTGKSLAYLVPSLLHDRRVVVATATLALQHQLVERDIPRLVEAVERPAPASSTSYAVLKGRSNYACLHRIREGVPDDQGVLVEVPAGLDGQEGPRAAGVGRGGGRGPAAPASATHAPRHTDREWRQVSVDHRECLGAAKCPFGTECFVEVAREKAQRSHLIVTNHSLLAIDAIEGVPMIPDYDVVVDRRGPRADRPGHPGRHRRARRSPTSSGPPGAPSATSTATRPTTSPTPPRRCSGAIDDCQPRPLRRGSRSSSPTRWCWSATPRGPASRRTPRRATPTPTPGRTQAKGSVQEVFANAERMAADSEADVLWLSEGERAGCRRGCAWRRCRCGGRCATSCSPTRPWSSPRDADARRRLLRGGQQHRPQARRAGARGRPGRAAGRPGRACPGAGIDVGSPFDYGQQGDPLRRPAPAAARARRPRQGPARRDRRARRRRRRAARSGCSPAAGPPRRPPRRCASGCRT